MVMVVKLEQLSNVLSSILVTELGMVIDVKRMQLENADSPILITPSGIFTVAKP